MRVGKTIGRLCDGIMVELHFDENSQCDHPMIKTDCPNKGNIVTLPSNEGLGPVMMYLLYHTHKLENMGGSSNDENMVEPTSNEKHRSVRFTMFNRVDGLSCFCLLGGL